MKQKFSKGMTFVELLIFSAIIVTIVAFSGGIIYRIFNDQKQLRFATTLTNLKDNYVALLQDNRNWKSTIESTLNSSSNFSCLENETDCSALNSPTAPSIFTPTTANGAAAYSYDPQAEADAGFDLNGNKCNGFDLATPVETCPVRITFDWRPTTSPVAPCDTTPCSINPYVDINITFTFSLPGSSSLRFNASNYSTLLTRKGASRVITQLSCGSNQALIGFDNDGNPICDDITDIVVQQCNIPWGGTLNHGSSVVAWQNSSVPCGNSCQNQTRTCNDGSLSGSYTNQSCTVQACCGGKSNPCGGKR